MRDDEYFAIKERAALALLRIPGVTAVGMGGRERNGQPTGEIVIKVFVERKKPAGDVPREELIPTSFEGVPTDVVEMGPPTTRLAGVPGARKPFPADDETLTQPMQGGTNIGVEPTSGGTLGCFLRDGEDGTAVYALTNHHVVKAGRRVSFSRRMLRPDGQGHFILFGYVAAASDDQAMDAAVIRLEADVEWLPSIKEVGPVKGMHTVTLAEASTLSYQVRKRGIKTRLTGGIVTAIAVQTQKYRRSDMAIRPNKAQPPHDDEQAHFAWHGDSGSVVVNDDDEVVALLWGIEDLTEHPDTPLLPAAYANPIALVLERFKEVHNLDLEVATGTASERVLPAAGVSRLPTSEFLGTSDRRHHRPLVGGAQIVAEPFGFANAGALGCVVTDDGGSGAAYILTSQRALSASGQVAPTKGDTDVGQPDNAGSCSQCCSNTIGEYAVGGPDSSEPTAALVKLEEDQKWLAEVMQIGLMAGTAALTAADVNSGAYQVRKRGPGSRLTAGVVTAVGGVAGTLPAGVRPDAMIIRPNRNPSKPGQPVCFSRSTDRGAVVVNEDNNVVGLLYDEIDLADGGVQVTHGVATPIDVVLTSLNALPGIEVVVATANAPDQVKTTTARLATPLDTPTRPVDASRRTPQESLPDGPAEVPVPAWALEWLQSELSRSVAGRLMTAMWSDHHGEISYLIDHNRRVATMWHRSGGPALLQALIRAWHTPSATVPSTVNGLPIATCFDRLARAFTQYGSPALQADMATLRGLLPPIGGLSLAEVIAVLNEG